MKLNTKVISMRTTTEDGTLIEQAAAQKGQAVSVWMRENLRQSALEQVYQTGDKNPFPNTEGEKALFRAILVTFQIVGVDTPDETKRLYAEKAARQIEKIMEEHSQ